MARLTPRSRRAAQVTASLAAGLALWEAAGWQFNSSQMVPALGSSFAPIAWIAEHLAPPALESHPGALPRLAEFIGDGEFFIALGQSLTLFAAGFAIALAIGVPLGILMARIRILRIALEGYVLALYTTPMAAMIPFVLAIFGYQFGPKVIVVTIFAVFPILYNTLEGARSLKPEMIEVARAFRSSEWRLWIDVVLPYTLPYALTGVRQGVGRALVGMVASEILLSHTGLGGWLVESSRSFDMAGVLGAILVITLLGIGLMGIARRLEMRVAAWRGTER